MIHMYYMNILHEVQDSLQLCGFQFCDIPNFATETNLHLRKPRYFFYRRMYNYMYLCKNKGKNMTKIVKRLMIPILRIHILRPAMSNNFTQNWRLYCTGALYTIVHHNQIISKHNGWGRVCVTVCSCLTGRVVRYSILF